MIRKLLLLLTITSCMFAGEIICEKDYQPALSKLQEMEEVQELLSDVLQDGDIHIRKNPYTHGQFEGMWVSEDRTIYITNECDMISTLLFELFNAKSDKKQDEIFRAAYAGNIGKEEYVRESERLEYENWQSCAQILDKGTQKGILPQSSTLPPFSDFDEYLRTQKQVGHSKVHGDFYDQICRHY